MDYPQGSMWRRWDLHVHTPDSVLRTHHPSWSEFLAKLEAAPSEICAIGLTDYGSIKGYERITREKSNGRLNNIPLILPNVELRMTPHHHPSKGINVHLIFDVSDRDHIEKIKTALGHLTYEYKSQRFGCSERELILLGHAFNTKAKSDEEALRVGLNQFRPSFKQFRDWYRADTWVMQNSLIIVDNGEEDGVSNLKADQGYKAERDEIYRFADAIFSSKPSDIDYFLGKKPGHAGDELATRYGGLKACICGCDTSDPEKLFKPDKDRFCWIKADPTFEGLRQILYEPEERVHIGPTFPEERDENRIINKLTLGEHGRPDWLKLEEILLNPGLIAIIGNKGTGKTALVDFIAYATGSWDQTTSTSFIKKSGIRNLDIAVGWRAGEPSRATIGVNYNSSDQRTRYLSQQFVEDLCANNMVGEKLRAEIEAVIFQHLSSDEQLGASGFSALRSKRTSVIRDERQGLWENMTAAISRYCDLLTKIDELPTKIERVSQLKQERDGLHAQIPKLDSAEQEANAQALAKARDRLSILSADIAALLSHKHDLETVRSKVNRFKRTMDAFHTEIIKDLTPFNLGEDAQLAFLPVFYGDTAAVLDRKSTEITALVEKLRGDVDDDMVKDTLHGTQKLIDHHSQQSSIDQQTKKRMEALQQRLRELAANLGNLEQEIKDIQENKIPQRDQNLKAMYNNCESILKTFTTENEILTSLYAPLSMRLSHGEPPERRLVFVIDQHVDLKAWTELGDALIDHTKRGPYKSSGALHAKAEELLLPSLKGNHAAEVVPALKRFLETFTSEGQPIVNQLKSGVSMAKFYEWLLSFQHISLRYSIKYNGIGLAQLSPGTKGLVLLMLYLEMDDNDRRPLLVDQPEENLDNESIYQTLRGYFRRAKRRRQIILVTHNPNLVVNTDADQVIVACSTESEINVFPSLSYVSGSLENSNTDPANPGIRQKVCAILEGGDAAFRNRERRYTAGH